MIRPAMLAPLGLIAALAAPTAATRAQGLPDPGFAPGERFPLETTLAAAGTGTPTTIASLHGGRKTLFIAYASW